MEAIPGWYGKLPELGDFASRRLPAAFIKRWDDWLQQNMSASRSALGEAWLEQYLSWPVWRFALMPGVIGPDAWAGVLMPSVDRVGRYFPLTVCAGLPASVALGTSIAAFDGWLARLEPCALAALDPKHGLNSLESGLHESPPLPGPDTGGTDNQAQACSAFVSGQASAGWLDRISAGLLPELLRGRSLWWCSDVQGAGAGFVRPDLPGAEAFTRMLRFRPA